MINGDTFVDQDDTPLSDFPDIDSFVEANAITGRFICTISKWDEATGEWAHCDSFQDRVPPPQEAVKLYDVGRIRWKFSFREKDPISGRKRGPQEYTMVIRGLKWEEMHEAYRTEMEEQRLVKLRKAMEKRRLENQILGTTSSAEPAGKVEERMLAQMSTFANIVKPQGNGDSKDFMMMMMKMMSDNAQAASQSSRDLVATMMQASQNQMNMMMAMLQQKSGNQNGPEFLPLFNSIMGMVTKTMEVKSDLNQAPDDRLSTILDFAKEVLPAAFKMLTPIPKPMQKSVVQHMVKDSPEFQTLKDNPELLADALKVWDKTFGPDKMDELLNAAGIPRPASTMSHYDDFAEPPQDSPANASEVSDANSVGAESGQ